MDVKILAALALVIVTGCSRQGLESSGSELQCTVDDSLSFTAVDISGLFANQGMLGVYLRDGTYLYRDMLDGEVCQRVEKIDWELVKPV